MSRRPKSGLEAIDERLTVLKERDHCSNAPRLRGKRQREMLGEICQDKVKSAQGGNTDAARQILEDFVRCVRQHSKKSWSGPNHYIYARYLADAFERILEGSTEPAIALGIKTSKPGRPRGTVKHDPIQLAAAYWLLHRAGYRPEKCITVICELTGADRTVVQDAREARYTKAFRRRDLVSDTQLKLKLRRWPHFKPFLKRLRVGALNRHTLLE